MDLFYEPSLFFILFDLFLSYFLNFYLFICFNNLSSFFVLVFCVLNLTVRWWLIGGYFMLPSCCHAYCQFILIIVSPLGVYVSICIFVYVCEWLSVLYIHTIHVCTCEIAFMYMWVCVYLCICVSVHSLYHVSLKESFDYSPAQGPALL